MTKVIGAIAVAMMWVSVQLAKWPVRMALKSHGVDSMEEFHAKQDSEEDRLAEDINEKNQEIPFPPKCVVCQGTRGVGSVANVTTDEKGNWFMSGSVVVCKHHLPTVWGKVIAVHVGPTDSEDMDGFAIMKARLEKAMEIDKMRAEHGLAISRPGGTEH